MRREFDDYATTERPTCKRCGGSLFVDRPVEYIERYESIPDAGNVLHMTRQYATTRDWLTQCLECGATGFETGWKIDFNVLDCGGGITMLVVRLIPEEKDEK